MSHEMKVFGHRSGKSGYVDVMFFPYREEHTKLDLFVCTGIRGRGTSPGWVEIERKKGIADCSSGVCPCVGILTRSG